METPGKKDIINTLYQSLLLASTTIGYSMLLKRFLRINIGPPSQANLEEILKLGGTVAISNGTLEYLYEQGIIPRYIMK